MPIPAGVVLYFIPLQWDLFYLCQKEKKKEKKDISHDLTPKGPQLCFSPNTPKYPFL
jgi:hypothetical protein